MQERKTGGAWIPANVFAVGPLAWKTFAAIQFIGRGTHEVRTTRHELAEICGCSVRTIARGLAALRDAGIIINRQGVHCQFIRICGTGKGEQVAHIRARAVKESLKALSTNTKETNTQSQNQRTPDDDFEAGCRLLLSRSKAFIGRVRPQDLEIFQAWKAAGVSLAEAELAILIGTDRIFTNGLAPAQRVAYFSRIIPEARYLLAEDARMAAPSGITALALYRREAERRKLMLDSPLAA